MIPAVGVQLRKKLRGADAATMEAAADAVRRAMSMGYVGFLSVEASSGIGVADGFDPAWAWDVMVHNFRADGLARLGMPAELRHSIQEFGQEALVSDLREAGLLGWRAGRVGLVGRYYAHAGGYLRATQTDFELPAQVRVFAAGLGGRWPYEKYARA
ncbi:MAG: hypothetical protein ACRDPC_07435 [Solirubrobacteraceae bacterium]